MQDTTVAYMHSKYNWKIALMKAYINQWFFALREQNKLGRYPDRTIKFLEQ